ncbi:hypothetical protein GPALN_004436 [Globodera pallida]|nr:hypothetical protein GPALN_004436 [Globodera pallida]
MSLYLGYDTLAAALQDEPETSSVLLYLLATLVCILLLVLLKMAALLHGFLNRKLSPVAPVHPPPTHANTTAIELGELRSAVSELVQRSEPMRRT